jgi:hypothetical protein
MNPPCTQQQDTAQRRNIERMTDDDLQREWRLVTRFPERPPIREAYIAAMADEFARRGLAQMEDERRRAR